MSGRLTPVTRPRWGRRATRSIGLGLGALVLSGCYEWQPAPPGPVTALDYDTHEQVRVTTVHGSTLIVRNPVLSGDSLVGFSEPTCRSSVQTGGQVVCAPPEALGGVALGEVDAVEVRARDPGRSALLGLGFVALIGWAFYLAIDSSVNVPDCYLVCS